MFDPQTVAPTWRERILAAVVTQQRRAWRRERRKDIGGLEETVLQAEKRAWERTDFLTRSAPAMGRRLPATFCGGNPGGGARGLRGRSSQAGGAAAQRCVSRRSWRARSTRLCGRRSATAGIPGASAAIVFPNGREWSLAVGAARLKPRVAMMTRTAFPFDSVSKMATAALALRLAEDGRLDLHDPVVRWYPGWRGDPAATVDDLLGHTSGARDISDVAFSRIQLSGRRLSVNTTLRASPRPGARTTVAEYSNTGFEIAGKILARAARGAARACHAPACPRRARR